LAAIFLGSRSAIRVVGYLRGFCPAHDFLAVVRRLRRRTDSAGHDNKRLIVACRGDGTVAGEAGRATSPAGTRDAAGKPPHAIMRAMAAAP
jgi:hypothetical protein